MTAKGSLSKLFSDTRVVGTKPFREDHMDEHNDTLLRCASPIDAVLQFAEHVARVTGCNPRRDGNSWVVNCLCHEADGGQHNASLAIFIGHNGRIAFCCRAGCPWDEVATALCRHGVALPDQASASDQLQIAREAERHTERMLELARRLWEDASSYGDSVAATSYLAARGLTMAPAEAATFRETNEGGRNQLLVSGIAAPATFREGHVQWTGVQTLALTNDGKPLLNSAGRKIRRIYGKLATNGVLLGYPSERMVVGEGIETVLSAMRILECDSGLASLSAVNLPRISLPPNVRDIEIAADHDDPGRRAAYALRRRLRQSGVTARIALPTSPGDDFNDVLIGRLQAAEVVKPSSAKSGEAKWNCDEGDNVNEGYP
jgi:putative DNA primase/helicase